MSIFSHPRDTSASACAQGYRCYRKYRTWSQTHGRRIWLVHLIDFIVSGELASSLGFNAPWEIKSRKDWDPASTSDEAPSPSSTPPADHQELIDRKRHSRSKEVMCINLRFSRARRLWRLVVFERPVRAKTLRCVNSGFQDWVHVSSHVTFLLRNTTILSLGYRPTCIILF